MSGDPVTGRRRSTWEPSGPFGRGQPVRDTLGELDDALAAIEAVRWVDVPGVSPLTPAMFHRVIRDSREKLLADVGRRVELVCECCGKGFEVVPSRRDKARFCSRSCFAEARRGPRPEVRQGETHTCEYCGETFYARPYRDPTYCSLDCKHAAGRATVVCEGCGDKFTVIRARADSARYCSWECRYPDSEGRENGDGQPTENGHAEPEGCGHLPEYRGPGGDCLACDLEHYAAEDQAVKRELTEDQSAVAD